MPGAYALVSRDGVCLFPDDQSLHVLNLFVSVLLQCPDKEPDLCMYLKSCAQCKAQLQVRHETA